MNGPEELDL